MPRITAVCYIFSLLFYVVGYFKMSVLNGGQLDAYTYTEYVFQATLFFVLTNFLIIVGTGIYYVKVTNHDVNVRVKLHERPNHRRRVSVPKVKTRYSSSIYGIKLDRRMSS